MSDQEQQHEVDELPDVCGCPQRELQEVQIEGMNSISVRVTNLLDGFYSMSSRLSQQSSQSSMNSTGKQQYADTPASSSPRQTSPSSPENKLNKNGNSSSSRRVKFRSMDGNDGSEIRQSGSSSYDMDMDASGTSHSSWGVRFSDTSPTGASGTQVSIIQPKDREITSLSSAVSGQKTTASFPKRDILSGSNPFHGYNNSYSNNYSDKNEKEDEEDPKWFEQYMPEFVVRIRTFCGNLVLDERFQLVMIGLIVANALTMGLATFDFIYNNDGLQNKFNLVDEAFLIAFTIELALEFGYWGYQLFFDGWLLFDFIIIALSWYFNQIQVFRSFRIFRAFRLVVRIPFLKSLVYAVFHVLPRISSIMMLFALVTYIYAVMCTILYQDYYQRGITSTDYFGRLDHSLFTMLQFVTLDNWSDVVRAVAVGSSSAYWVFGTLLVITGFILYSLVVAVICDSFLRVEAKIRREINEKAKRDRERRRSMLKRRISQRHIFKDGDSSSHSFSCSFSESQNQFTVGEVGRNESQTRMELSIAHVEKTPDERQHEAAIGGKKHGKFDTEERLSRLLTPTKAKIKSAPNRTTVQSNIYSSPDAHTAAGVAIGLVQDIGSAVDDDVKKEGTIDEDDETDHFPDPLITTLATSPETLTTTATTTIAGGELERKRRKRNVKRPAKSRILKVQHRLDR